jgi:hypothetical protein
MTDKPTPEVKRLCPVCRRPMILLHEITPTYFAENLYVFKCGPCGLSMTEPVSLTTRPPDASASRKNCSRNRARKAKRAMTMKPRPVPAAARDSLGGTSPTGAPSGSE